ncbi:MAG: F0F1 ATP synthase subunit B [Planctomycetota bacterium]|jgi:F-type H+-transporting ATPase subunit b|nr:F0F1 ATP synthase subunit B [Blastopirellula sp.]
MNPVWMLSVAAAAEEAHGKPNAMEFSPDLAIFTFLVFVGLLFVLTKFAWKPILAGLEKREKTISDQVDGAKRMYDEAKQNLAEYEQKLASVTQQANDILAEARKDAVTAKERILAEAAAEAEQQRQRAVADIRAAKDAAVRELAQKSADAAVGLAGKIVGRSLKDADHQNLISDSIDRFVKGA